MLDLGPLKSGPNPYHVLSQPQYNVTRPIYIESLEVCAIKDTIPEVGPAYLPAVLQFIIGKMIFLMTITDILLLKNQPLAVCDKTIGSLENLKNPDITISNATWYYNGSGCY